MRTGRKKEHLTKKNLGNSFKALGASFFASDVLKGGAAEGGQSRKLKPITEKTARADPSPDEATCTVRNSG